MSTQSKQQAVCSRLRSQAAREPTYHDSLAGAVDEMLRYRESKVRELDDHDDDCVCVVPAIPVCLGPGRCETLDNDQGCKWCMMFPHHEGRDYAETFLAIHDKGH